MSKNVIKDLTSFCKHNNVIEGSVVIPAEELLDITSRDCRLNATPITIEFKLQGSVSNTGLYFISGEWRALTDLNCSFCCHKMDYLLVHHYDNLRLIDETLSSLDYEGECFECRFDL
ncbi:hypothetical protein EBS02_06945, partial [bacterium]|nr:hypothetical protein [bacterium]